MGNGLLWLDRYTKAATWHWQGQVYHLGPRSVATNSWSIVAVADGGEQARLWLDELGGRVPAFGQEEAAKRKIGNLATQKVSYQLTTTIRQLTTWAGAVQIWPPDSMTYTQPECGLLCGLKIARSRLAFLLAPELWDMGESVLKVGLAKMKPRAATKALTIDGNRVRLVMAEVMPGYPEVDCGPVAPFYPDDLFLQLWMGREDPVCRAMLADWLEERGDPYAGELRRQCEEGES